jgi:hypothetical protein
MACDRDPRAARVQAYLDFIKRTDNSHVVEQAFDAQAQLHYAAYKSKLNESRTLGPLEDGKLSPAKTSARAWLTGDIADMHYRPSEILGDDIAESVLTAYDKYSAMMAKEGQKDVLGLRPETAEATAKIDPDRLLELREDSGLLDAVEEAKDLAYEKFENDPDRLEYTLEWLKRFESPNRPGDVEKALRYLTGNLSKNLLLNNIRAGVQNHLQLAVTTLPEYGGRLTRQGWNDYHAAVQAKSPELAEAQIGKARFYEEAGNNLDFFNRPESMNQGVTYFTAKAKALAEGKTESEARTIGRKAIEQLQFKHRAGNEPRAQWNTLGSVNMSLMSYMIQFRRTHNRFWGEFTDGLKAGAKSGNYQKAQDAARKLGYMYLANGIVNGVTSDIPIEIAGPLQYFNPKFYGMLRQLDRASITGMFDMDTAEISRTSLLAWTQIAKVPLFFDAADNTREAIQKALDHPDKPLKYIQALKAAGLFLPTIKGPIGQVVSNKHLGDLVEFTYRSITGDWTRYTRKGKEYQSTPWVEGKKVVTGRSFGQHMETDKLDTRRSSGF